MSGTSSTSSTDSDIKTLLSDASGTKLQELLKRTYQVSSGFDAESSSLLDIQA
ncbi:hypothetical protein [Paenibacillus ferrarius]|uniref:hypothetical protein n=1 Tax=Paenibacillus ferrarius TaxID=1469647 RepID=UPI001301D172|nr:hypothetical protein [Paenibacillus ferrarius]